MENNPFAQDNAIRSKQNPENSEPQIKPLKARSKHVSDKTLRDVDTVSIRTGWATDDERARTNNTATQVTVQLGVRVSESYLKFVKKVCADKRQTKRVIVEEALDEYCKKHGYPDIAKLT